MKKPATHPRAFTLVELLPAMVLLTLLGFIIAQMTGATSRTTRLSNQLVDTASQARLVFGCLEGDIAGLVKRPDVPFEARNAALGAVPLLRFVSGSPAAGSRLGSAANRGISILAYEVAAHADNQNRPCLLRAGKAVPWAMTGYFGLTDLGLPLSFSGAGFPSSLLPQSADFDVLAPGVLRLVIGFQLYPDNQPVTLQDGTTLPKAQGQVVYSPPVRTAYAYRGTSSVQVVDLSRVAALVAGVAVVDVTSLRLLDADQATALGSAFGVPATDVLPVAAWEAQAMSPTTLPGSVPLAARQSLRVFQHFFPVTPFASRL
ncbi:hypothetical protein SAMN05444156_0836 [Verrucomicrobium sp. GAS474]|uniref:PulJ/GspJ family protein n=1 Tax=Verrucomicrobium sp. GAS474 TaxID=1882831 RepID=UPI00087B477B|nr:hypothetical protein [Verrucomicrobium sp. GAS474]SDT93016.1 hypothetical protein SAMN05444156_0836 [Verrucomicrobium sp. GAS474]